MPSKLDLLTSACAGFGRGRPAVRSALCPRTRHRKSECRRCTDACPAGAVSCGDELAVSADLCAGCGACAAVCPAGALEATRPSDAELRTQIARHVKASGAVAFACERCLASRPADRARAVAVPCIARLDETILVEAVLAGASKVVLADTLCDACPQAELRRLAEATAARAARLLSQWRPVAIGLGQDLSGFKPLPDDRPAAAGVSRRAFFSGLRAGTAEAARPNASPPPQPVGTDIRCGSDRRPKQVPERLRRLVETLRRLATPSSEERTDVGLWGELTVSGNCNGCGICADVCPTGALTVEGEGSGWSLHFLAADCIRCGLCGGVCFAGAIRLEGEASIAAVLDRVPKTLAVMGMDEVGKLTEPLDERFSRLFGCQVTS